MLPLSETDRLFDSLYPVEVQAHHAGDWRHLAAKPPWRVAVRKVTFSPWSEPSSNPELVYWQVIDGLRKGAYLCHGFDEMAGLLALRYAIEHGQTMDQVKLLSHVQQDRLASMVDRPSSQWASAVEKIHAEVGVWRVLMHRVPSAVCASALAPRPIVTLTWGDRFCRSMLRQPRRRISTS